MSYCRWSCLNGYCDVYVYEDVNGGWTTHVASRRIPPGCPVNGMSLITAISLSGPTRDLLLEVQRIERDWRDAHPSAPIDLPEAGTSFNHDTPGECADNLERLRGLGFVVPLFAIQALREEQREMDVIL